MSERFPMNRAFDDLAQRLLAGQVNRRQLILRAGALGITTGMASTLLAACGDDDDDDDDDDAAPGVDPTPTTADEEEPEDDEDEEPEEDDEEDEPEDDDGIERGGELAIGIASDLTTMDPHRSTAAVDRQVYQLVYDKLVDIDEGLNIVPELAETWEISDDGTEYTFNLVEGATFHDGEPFNAAAMKFNFDRMLDEETASPRRSEILQVEEVEEVDEYTLRLGLSQAFSPLLATLTDRAGMAISPKAVEELGDDLARNPVGTGPFSFVEWLPDDHLTVERNPSWWKEGLPYLDRVTYIPIVDATVKLASLRTNDVQLVDGISTRDAESAANDPSLVYSEVAGLAFQYLQLNSSAPPFDVMALRQAVAWTLDRDAIAEVLYFGTGSAAQTPIPPSSWAYDESVQVYQQDYDMAREKLAEGGMPDGFEFDMMVTNAPDAIQTAEVYQAQMAEAGIIANLELLEFGTLLDRLNASNFSATVLGWSGRPDPDGNIYGYFHSEGGLNRGGYSNPEVDRLLDETRAVSDPDERRALYSEVTRLIAEDAPMVFVHFPAQIKVWQPSVQGYIHVPDGMMRMDTVWLSQS